MELRLQERAARETDGRLTLVAVDATWNGARSLVGGYDEGIIKVQLEASNVFCDNDGQSLMAPLRKYKPQGNNFSKR